MIKLELSRAADADLVAILEYGDVHFGWAAAEAYVAGFNQAFDLLLDHPRIGVLVDDVRPPVRSLAHRRHRIFYDLEEDMILVRRILHMSVDITRHL